MKHIIFILLATACLIFKCTPEVRFTEKIIDNNAPKALWMKTVGDVNGDRKIDLLAGGWEKGGMVAYLAPDWKKLIICDTLKISTDAEVCDIDNDQNPDVIAITNEALIWLSGPDWKLNIVDSLELHDLEVGDFDNDGLTDVIARNQAEWGKGDTIYIYHQQPLGNWNKHRKIIIDGEGLKMADVNGDSKKDIIVNGYWFENTGNISEWKEHKFSDTWNWRNTYIDVADMNNDGLSDILLSPSELAGGIYHVSWFEAPEDPGLIWKENIVADSVESVIHFLGTADFNNDGKIDIMTAGMQQGIDPDEVTVFCQRRENRWKKKVISKDGSHSMRLFDMDGDGDTDAFGANWNDSIVKIWINENIK